MGEHRLGPAGTFEDDLERRKHAVLTALCDAVLTTSATFIVYGSDDGADRIFRRPMLNELLTDYFKDEAEKERFVAAVKKQFPEDASIGEGPKRMRVMLRDADDESFEADVVVSDASTDKDGKVNKYMVGMHIRGEHRARPWRIRRISPGQVIKDLDTDLRVTERREQRTRILQENIAKTPCITS